MTRDVRLRRHPSRHPAGAVVLAGLLMAGPALAERSVEVFRSDCMPFINCGPASPEGEMVISDYRKVRWHQKTNSSMVCMVIENTEARYPDEDRATEVAERRALAARERPTIEAFVVDLVQDGFVICDDASSPEQADFLLAKPETGKGQPFVVVWVVPSSAISILMGGVTLVDAPDKIECNAEIS